MWPWCDKVASLSLPRTLQRMGQPNPGPGEEKERVIGPAESDSMFLLVSLLRHLRPHCPFSAKALEMQQQRDLATQPGSPEPGACPLWEQGPAAWSWWRVSLFAWDQNHDSVFLQPAFWSPHVPWCPPFAPQAGVLVKLLAGTGLISSSCIYETAAQQPGHFCSGLSWEVRPFGDKGKLCARSSGVSGGA